MNLSLKNKVALITGGSAGIGAAIAIKLTREGAKVAIVGRNRDKLNNVSETCERLGSKPLVIVADITKPHQVTRVATETIEFFGKVDILVNNAGIAGSCSIMNSTAMTNYDKIMALNLYPVVQLTHLLAKNLVEAKGNIINISSVGSKTVIKDGFAYATSKAALDHFTRSIAFELAPKGVRVNSVNKGPVRSGMFDDLGLNTEEIDNMWAMLEKLTLLDKVADAEEIADLVAFVVSNKGRSITGATLVADNGTLLKGAICFDNEV